MFVQGDDNTSTSLEPHHPSSYTVFSNTPDNNDGYPCDVELKDGGILARSTCIL